MIVVPPIVWSLSGILGLLVYWRRYQERLRAGLVTATDLFHASGVRWHLYVVADDPDVCVSCRNAHGVAFLSRTVRRTGFTPLAKPCPTPDKCSGVLLAFAGRWLWADDVVASLKTAKTDRRRLSPMELRRLASLEWKDETGEQDRIGLYLLAGLLYERESPEQAVRSYGAVLKRAVCPRDQAALMVSYLRLSGLLARRGHAREALQVIEHFEKRLAQAELGTFTPPGRQRRALLTMKPYVAAAGHQAPGISKPATIDRPASDDKPHWSQNRS